MGTQRLAFHELPAALRLRGSAPMTTPGGTSFRTHPCGSHRLWIPLFYFPIKFTACGEFITVFERLKQHFVKGRNSRELFRLELFCLGNLVWGYFVQGLLFLNFFGPELFWPSTRNYAIMIMSYALGKCWRFVLKKSSTGWQMLRGSTCSKCP